MKKINKRRSQSTAVACLMLLALPLIGCAEATNAIVTIDNGSPVAMTVEIDGKAFGLVPANNKLTTRVPLGSHSFKVVAAGQTIYESTQTLLPTKDSYTEPCFLLNPDKSQRYCVVEVVYGNNRMESAATGALTSLVSMAAVATAENDPKMDVERVKQNELRGRYQRMLNETLPMEASEFFQFSSQAKPLEPMPQVVFSRRSASKRRWTLMRVPEEIHTFLLDGKNKTDYTDADIEELNEVQSLVQSLVPVKD